MDCLNEAHGDSYTAYHGDCVAVCGQLPDECIDFSVYSPPFGQLFVYSDSIADMGNSFERRRVRSSLCLSGTGEAQNHEARPAHRRALF